jgi:hypothetical protein
MGTLIRSHDWEKTSLGSPDAWPQSLRTVVNILLTSRYAMWLGWGESLSFLYNNAYRPTLGLKHPWALGTPAAEVWAEIWREVGPRVQTVLSTGEATYDEGLLLFLERSGFPEETYHTFSYSPLADDSGRVSVHAYVVTEETERHWASGAWPPSATSPPALPSNTEAEVLEVVERQLGQNCRDLPFTLAHCVENGEARLARATGMPSAHAAPPNESRRVDALRLPKCSVIPSAIEGRSVAQWGANSYREAGMFADRHDLNKQQGHERPVVLPSWPQSIPAIQRRLQWVRTAGQVAAGPPTLAPTTKNGAGRSRPPSWTAPRPPSNVSHEFRTPLTSCWVRSKISSART